MNSRDELRKAERAFMEDVQRQAGSLEPQRSGDTFMYAGHVEGDMFVLGDLSPEAAIELLRRRRAGRRQ